MYKRKCNWCIFNDGHRERITGLFDNPFTKDIEFSTRSGHYKYSSPIGLPLEIPPFGSKNVPAKRFVAIGPCFQKLRFIKEFSPFTGQTINIEYVPEYRIARIELIT